MPGILSLTMKVSIYTPTKNRKEALIKAIDSVLNQTYKNIELIVVNDGSTDGTAEYLENRAKQDIRLKVFNKTRSEGAPVARNLAIKYASGEFVTGLDDDDEFLPERVQSFVDYWHLLTKLGCKPSCLYAQDIVMRHGSAVFTSQKKGLINAEDLFEFNYIGNQIFAPKAHFIAAGLFDENLPAWQDLEMFMRVLKMFGTAHLLDLATQLYDDSPKQDRISVKSESKIRHAYTRVSKLHASNSGRDAQKLVFQMFSKYYGVRPGIRDWMKFIQLGFWPRGLLKLAIRTVRY